MAEVKLNQLVKSYNDTQVIKDVTMTIKDGEFVTLVGPSGCGKSTLLRCIAGLEDITKGDLYIAGTHSNHIPAKDRGIAMVFQSYALFPHMTVEANIGFGLKIKKTPEDEKREKIAWAIKLLHLNDLEQRYPRELSGGQRQRVAIGRSLVLDPGVLLLDEPLSNLDAKLRLRMRTEFKRLHKALGRTTIYVTHDQVEAMTLSDRIAILNQGVAEQVGTPEEVYKSPATRFVAGFIGSPPINIVDCRLLDNGGMLFVEGQGIRLGLGNLTEERKGRLQQVVNQDLLLGIRPQDIYMIDDQQVSGISDNLLKVGVELIEPLGEQIVLVVKVGNESLRATLPSETDIAVDQSLELAVDTRNLHLFDRTTEKALI